MALEQPPFDVNYLATEEDLRALLAANFVDDGFCYGRQGVGGFGLGDAAADSPSKGDGIQHAKVTDSLRCRGFGCFAHSAAHFTAGGSEGTVYDLVVGCFGHDDRLAIS